MKKYEIKILDTAKRDLYDTFRFISEILGNEVAARTHLIDIYHEISKLEHMPRAHKIYEGESILECRVARVRQYLILYTVDDDKDAVYIMRIYHSHRNPNEFNVEKVLETFNRLREE